MANGSGNLKEIQNELYELMKIVHEFCESNGIDYSLTGGSLLGAIRHQGFIPWDDDLDIMLTRDNYEKFQKCFIQCPPDNCVLERDQWVFRVRKSHKTKGYVPSIDLFIIDKVPSNLILGKIQVVTLKVLQGLMRTNEKKGNYSFVYQILIVVSELLGKLISKESLFLIYDTVSQWGRKSNSHELSIFDDRFKLIGLRYNESMVNEYLTYTFRDSEFEIIQRYDDYLILQFGDYMQIPPEKERVPQHIF